MITIHSRAAKGGGISECFEGTVNSNNRFDK